MESPPKQLYVSVGPKSGDVKKGSRLLQPRSRHGCEFWWAGVRGLWMLGRLVTVMAGRLALRFQRSSSQPAVNKLPNSNLSAPTIHIVNGKVSAFTTVTTRDAGVASCPLRRRPSQRTA